ncbi:MAG: CheR family methyltransferase [Candidatus Brocadiaceae bacterium]
MADLEHRICSAAREFGFTDIDAFMKWLQSYPLTRNHIEILASHLTIGETYFFREKEGFLALEETILPELVRLRAGNERRIRIWSAGCSTGEEPYSIAVALSRMIVDIKDWNITILATDINPRFLRKASHGIYTEWSFRNVPLWLKDKYFTSTKHGQYEILSTIKKMVTFAYLNLADDIYPSLLNNTNAMDVIFCRNVLMYFTPENTKKIIQKFSYSLVDRGWLMVSPCEVSNVPSSQLTPVHFPGATIYRKENKQFPRVGEFLPGDFLKYGKMEEPVTSALTTFKDADRIVVEDVPPQTCSPGEPYEIKILETQQAPYDEAFALYKQCRYEETIQKLTELLSRDASVCAAFPYDEAVAILSRSYANQGQLSLALEWCERAIAKNKVNPGFHYLRATILQEQGQVAESVKSLKRALYLDQDFTLAHFALGILCQTMGKLQESHKHFENALSLLNVHSDDEIVPESEGITVKRLTEIIMSTRH